MKNLLTAMLLALGSHSVWATVESGSDGSDGVFPPDPTQTELVLQLPPDGVFNFTSVNIPANMTVRFLRNARNTPVVWLVQGDVTIDGVIDLNATNAVDTGTATSDNGNIGNDGAQGFGGPGGFDGGRGGILAAAQRLPGSHGLGPGGGGVGVSLDDGQACGSRAYDRNSTRWSRQCAHHYLWL